MTDTVNKGNRILTKLNLKLRLEDEEEEED